MRLLSGHGPYMHCRATIAALEADKARDVRWPRTGDECQRRHTRCERVSRQKTHLIAQIVPSPMTLRADNTIKTPHRRGIYRGMCLPWKHAQEARFSTARAPLQWRQDFDLSGLNIMSMGIWYEALIRWVGEATQNHGDGAKPFVKMRPDADGVMRSVRIPEHIDVVGDLACGARTSTYRFLTSQD